MVTKGGRCRGWTACGAGPAPATANGQDRRPRDRRGAARCGTARPADRADSGGVPDRRIWNSELARGCDLIDNARRTGRHAREIPGAVRPKKASGGDCRWTAGPGIPRRARAGNSSASMPVSGTEGRSGLGLSLFRTVDRPPRENVTWKICYRCVLVSGCLPHPTPPHTYRSTQAGYRPSPHVGPY